VQAVSIVGAGADGAVVEASGVICAGILHAAIRMMDQAGGRIRRCGDRADGGRTIRPAYSAVSLRGDRSIAHSAAALNDGS
jgi:hypothetical protein